MADINFPYRRNFQNVTICSPAGEQVISVYGMLQLKVMDADGHLLNLNNFFAPSNALQGVTENFILQHENQVYHVAAVTENEIGITRLVLELA